MATKKDFTISNKELNTQILKTSRKLMNYSKIDLNNPEEVQIRINEFFQIYEDSNLKPTINGLCLMLGVSDVMLWNYLNDINISKLNPSSLIQIKNTYQTLRILNESYQQENAINPVSGIFLGKNFYKLKDSKEIQNNYNINLSQTNIEQLEDKYKDYLPVEDYKVE